MNTVISALALDYPPEKLSVYLSDDGGSFITLYAIKEAHEFAKSWIPFCREYGIKTRCPEAYFSLLAEDERLLWSDQFKVEEENIKSKYEIFKKNVENVGEKDENNCAQMDRPPCVEILHDNRKDEENNEDKNKMPMLVYVSRERRPSYPHRYKAGALNALLRVSGIISNAPYVLVLDCDMYCNDPTSARQAMCFHLDPHMSRSLAFVQYPQIFYNVSKNDIYDGQARSAYTIGFSYGCMLESSFTGYLLHCKGWTSVYLYPKRPCFMGCTTIDMKDAMVQLMKWNSELIKVGLSKFSPLTYGVSRMSILQSMCYGYFNLQPLLSVALLLYAIVPQLCLINGTALYPKVSSPWFGVFSVVYLSSLCQHLYEVLSTGGTLRTFWNEQRMWFIKSVSGSLFGCLDAIMKRIGIQKANLRLTNKAVDKEKLEKYEKGRFNFQGAAMFTVPLIILGILNLVCFFGGLRRVILENNIEVMFGQVFLSSFHLLLSYPILQGLIPSKRKRN
ncbi:hypothetical protein LWI29_005770 [Acer saccharum]|uniref:Cellulose synthase-like protein G2 n=1 Tax=Acer saccharum TaxID=4024 RepID=A0AA39TAW7_ACESA|nr:hypothetical protein LWI29_005770 [Acer saccharum]